MSWTFEFEHLLRTPSSECEYSLQQELAERARAVDFMFRVGLTLGLPLTPMYTAATYFHRLYMRHSLADFNWHESSMACLFLAAKIEETSRKLADTARMAMAKSRGLNPERHNFSSADSQRELNIWQQNIQEREEMLVETLCFDFVVRHPQAELCELFDVWPDEQDADALDFLQAATWTVANDAFRTPICVLAEPNVAAYACFLVAAQAAGRAAIPDFLLMRERLQVEQPSIADTARRVLRVEDRDFDVVLDCMTLLRDYYAHTTEQVGRFAFIECLVALPLPPASIEYYTPSVARSNGHASDTGADGVGDQTPQSDGSKTPGGLSVSGLSQGTADSS